MASSLGHTVARGVISTNADTAVVAAPGAGQHLEILWITLTTSVAGTTSRLRVENGAGGGVIARMATVTADALLNLNYATGLRERIGNQLDTNTALNINTSGGAAATVNYEVGYRVCAG